MIGTGSTDQIKEQTISGWKQINKKFLDADNVSTVSNVELHNIDIQRLESQFYIATTSDYDVDKMKGKSVPILLLATTESSLMQHKEIMDAVRIGYFNQSTDNVVTVTESDGEIGGGSEEVGAFNSILEALQNISPLDSRINDVEYFKKSYDIFSQIISLYIEKRNEIKNTNNIDEFIDKFMLSGKDTDSLMSFAKKGCTPIYKYIPDAVPYNLDQDAPEKDSTLTYVKEWSGIFAGRLAFDQRSGVVLNAHSTENFSILQWSDIAAPSHLAVISNRQMDPESFVKNMVIGAGHTLEEQLFGYTFPQEEENQKHTKQFLDLYNKILNDNKSSPVFKDHKTKVYAHFITEMKTAHSSTLNMISMLPYMCSTYLVKRIAESMKFLLDYKIPELNYIILQRFVGAFKRMEDGQTVCVKDVDESMFHFMVINMRLKIDEEETENRLFKTADEEKDRLI